MPLLPFLFFIILFLRMLYFFYPHRLIFTWIATCRLFFHYTLARWLFHIKPFYLCHYWYRLSLVVIWLVVISIKINQMILLEKHMMSRPIKHNRYNDQLILPMTQCLIFYCSNPLLLHKKEYYLMEFINNFLLLDLRSIRVFLPNLFLQKNYHL